jgi:hypothetical protein
LAHPESALGFLPLPPFFLPPFFLGPIFLKVYLGFSLSFVSINGKTTQLKPSSQICLPHPACKPKCNYHANLCCGFFLGSSAHNQISWHPWSESWIGIVDHNHYVVVSIDTSKMYHNLQDILQKASKFFLNFNWWAQFLFLLQFRDAGHEQYLRISNSCWTLWWSQSQLPLDNSSHRRTVSKERKCQKAWKYTPHLWQIALDLCVVYNLSDPRGHNLQSFHISGICRLSISKSSFLFWRKGA